MRRLADFVDPALGWELAEAKAINARGMIVGSGTRNGEPRGFKLALPICVREGTMDPTRSLPNPPAMSSGGQSPPTLDAICAVGQ